MKPDSGGRLPRLGQGSGETFRRFRTATSRKGHESDQGDEVRKRVEEILVDGDAMGL
jgi:Sec-independent protein translocase protein TatA